MSRAILAIVFTVLHLVACGSRESGPKAGDLSDAVQAPALPILPTAPIEARPSVPAPTLISEEDAVSTTQGPAIPLEYRGRWTALSESCEDVEEYWVYIRANRMDFYESLGTVRAVRQLASAVELDLEFSSEDQTWLETRILRLSDDQQTITGSITPDSARQFTLVRCTPIQ
jgi:hypothetical protein